MFSTPITRPFRWALPLAIAGLVVSTLVTLVPAKAGGLECGSVSDYLWGRGVFFEGGGWFGYSPQTSETFDTFTECRRMLRRRAAAAGVVDILAFAPLTVFAVCGFLWGANTLYRLSEERTTDSSS